MARRSPETVPARFTRLRIVSTPACVRRSDRRYSCQPIVRLVSVDAAVLAQEFLAAFGDGDTQAVRGRPPRDIAAVDGVFPDRQPRAGGAPGVDHLGVKPRLARDPF